MNGSPERRKFGRIAPAVALCCTLVAGSALAGALSDAATKAEALAAAGDAIGAHDVMRSAISDFSVTLPFSIGKAVFVTADPVGYAMYDPKDKPVFKPGEPLVSYIEPVGLVWKPSSLQGKIETHFTVDFDILDTKGVTLANQKAIGDFKFSGFLRNQELYASLSVDIGNAPAGDYVLRFHFNDINSGKTASADQPFTISSTP